MDCVVTARGKNARAQNFPVLEISAAYAESFGKVKKKNKKMVEIVIHFSSVFLFT